MVQSNRTTSHPPLSRLVSRCTWRLCRCHLRCLASAVSGHRWQIAATKMLTSLCSISLLRYLSWGAQSCPRAFPLDLLGFRPWCSSSPMNLGLSPWLGRASRLSTVTLGLWLEQRCTNFPANILGPNANIILPSVWGQLPSIAESWRAQPNSVIHSLQLIRTSVQINHPLC
jgi:hypothetical protein